MVETNIHEHLQLNLSIVLDEQETIWNRLSWNMQDCKSATYKCFVILKKLSLIPSTTLYFS